MVGPRASRHARRVVLGGVSLLAVFLSGCSTGRNSVTGLITPAHFEFQQVVKKSGPRKEPGGWWAVCIHASITNGDSGATAVCKFEVGMPVRNGRQGEISLENAQLAAATMANRAVYEILSDAHPGTMHAIHCIRFKRLYNLMLKEKIDGAEVGECGTRGVKTVLFLVPYPSEPR
jgi:hypothetical protein